MAREMKDSGVEWIGEIPVEWNINTLSQLFFQIKNKNNDLKETNLLSLSYGRIKRKSIDISTGLLPESFDSYNIIEKDDLVFRLTDLQNDHTSLRVGLAEERGIITSAYLTIRGKSYGCPQYFFYYFYSFDVAKGFYGMGAGVRQGLNWDGVKSLKVLVPSIRKQEKIVSYLSKKCAEIDALLEKIRASIEEYKKLKQAIITQAVTKGVRGDRPMKDSGIEWVKTIPIEWNICKTLRYLSMPITDGPHTTPALYDEGIPFVSAEAVSCGNGHIDFSHIRGYISAEFYQECCKKYIPKMDDIYMIKSGATTGKVAIVDTDKAFTIWSPLAVFRCDKATVIPKYLFFFLQSMPYQKQVEFGWSYGTQQNVGMRTLERLKVFVPPLDEQREIVEYLENKISDVDFFIQKKNKVVSEFESYKESLIYEYVTGKKGV